MSETRRAIRLDFFDLEPLVLIVPILSHLAHNFSVSFYHKHRTWELERAADMLGRLEASAEAAEAEAEAGAGACEDACIAVYVVPPGDWSTDLKQTGLAATLRAAATSCELRATDAATARRWLIAVRKAVLLKLAEIGPASEEKATGAAVLRRMWSSVRSSAWSSVSKRIGAYWGAGHAFCPTGCSTGCPTGCPSKQSLLAQE